MYMYVYTHMRAHAHTHTYTKKCVYIEHQYMYTCLDSHIYVFFHMYVGLMLLHVLLYDS